MDFSGFSFDSSFDFNTPSATVAATPPPVVTQASFFDQLTANLPKIGTEAISAGAGKLIAKYLAPNETEQARLTAVRNNQGGIFGQLFTVGVKPDLSSPVIWAAVGLVAVLILVLVSTRK